MTIKQNNNNELQTIHDFEFKMICDFFSNMHRQGPGNIETTLKALSFVKGLTENSKIADLGCGTGGQTFTLANNTKGEITAVDLFSDFIEKLNQKARTLNIHEKVKGMTCSMENLPFKKNEFDLIWSEGAIYNIGFEKGLKEWREYLKEGGYIAVSEISWFSDSRPLELENFWTNAYPEIDTIPNQVSKIFKTGYLPIATFTLPDECWYSYFDQKEEAEKVFLEKYTDNTKAKDFIHSEKYTDGLYSKYKDYYGYTFFIAKKTNTL